MRAAPLTRYILTLPRHDISWSVDREDVPPWRTAMTRWTVDAPTTMEFDDVTALHVRLIAGTVAVLASDDKLSSPGGTTPRTPRPLPGEEASVPGRQSSPGGTTPRTPRPLPGEEASVPGRATVVLSE